MAEFDEDTIVSMLGEAGGAPRAAVDAVQHHGLSSLLNGTALTVAEIASLSALGVSDIEDGVGALAEVGRIDLDAYRRRYGDWLVEENLLPVGANRRNWKHTLVSDGYLLLRHPDWEEAKRMAHAAATDVTMIAS